MSFASKTRLIDLNGSADYKNSKGNHECVVLVQMVSGAPSTSNWKQGKKVMDCSTNEISAGTVIATFDESGKYPSVDRHAAIYENHDTTGINVIDQWNKQGMAKKRKIHSRKGTTRNVNDADWYYIVE